MKHFYKKGKKPHSTVIYPNIMTDTLTKVEFQKLPKILNTWQRFEIICILVLKKALVPRYTASITGTILNHGTTSAASQVFLKEEHGGTGEPLGQHTNVDVLWT